MLSVRYFQLIGPFYTKQWGCIKPRPTRSTRYRLLHTGGQDPYDAVSGRSFSAKEPLIIELSCGKWPIKIRHPMHPCHPVSRDAALESRDLLMRPPWLGRKGSDLLEISNTNLPYSVKPSLMVQEFFFKTCPPIVDKRASLSNTNLPSPLAIDTPITPLTNPRMWHDSFVYVTRFIHVWHDSFTYVTWLIHICDMTHAYMWHPHAYMWHDSFMHVSWLINTCQSLNKHIIACHMWSIHVTWLPHIRTHSFLWHDSSKPVKASGKYMLACQVWSIHVTWLIHICDMTHSYMRHDSFI